MAIAFTHPREKFITTEPIGKGGEASEQIVWDAVQDAFAGRDCLGYWRYPIFSKVGKSRKEPDILMADASLGLIVIEIKSVRIEQILALAGHRWEFQNYYTTSSNPYEQAENQLFTLLGYCDREPSLRRQVSGRALVCLPQITEEQWYQSGFYQLPSCPPLIFQNHLRPSASRGGSLIHTIEKTTPVIKGTNLTLKQWKLLKSVISGTPILGRKRPLGATQPHNPPQNQQTRASVLAEVRQRLGEFDLQQEHIGKEIPPGPQRIRGIAGSGKTVLLCQKAAHMHLKHPDWDIAFVFFSRSLYQPIIAQLDQWLRRFSGGEVGYDSKNRKLRSLHAWGAKNQPGLYSTLCQVAGVKRLTVNDTQYKQPNQALAAACLQLLHNTVIPTLYDAILIDEGQDLMVDDALKFQGKQPFYWMAYQALRPIDPAHPEQRRLIWGYDEAQSLESLTIPNASELFGEDLGHLVTGQYPGGIKKSEIIHRCYRTPGPILTAAHGIGMGLLRPGGMLTGMTRAEDWQAIGYEVTGHFIPGGQITLRRPPENSPNLVPELWLGSVLEFVAYRSRQEELTALVENILYNLRHDSLKPSREILVIVLGSGWEAMKLETDVAEFLMSQGIDIYIPSTLDCNILIPDPENHDPNKFWCEGGVTVSRIHRAKGNEADLVYVVGLDQVAKDESNLQLRNQLFVALTRAKGWVKLSGLGAYPMYEEMWRVIQSGDSFTFTFRRPPQREISVTDASEMQSRYNAGGRNFQNADLVGAQLAGADLRNANLIGAILQNADLRNAQLAGAKLVIADLRGADLTNANLQKAKLVGANLREAKLRGADLSRAKLGNADLRNTQLVGAKLVGVKLSGADLTGADLTGAFLEAVDLSDVNLQGARMPDGSMVE